MSNRIIHALHEGVGLIRGSFECFGVLLTLMACGAPFLAALLLTMLISIALGYTEGSLKRHMGGR